MIISFVFSSVSVAVTLLLLGGGGGGVWVGPCFFMISMNLCECSRAGQIRLQLNEAVHGVPVSSQLFLPLTHAVHVGGELAHQGDGRCEHTIHMDCIHHISHII